ncbi:MAG: hypothetical protein U0996_27130 [Planctomycetaceae bacterium]
MTGLLFSAPAAVVAAPAPTAVAPKPVGRSGQVAVASVITAMVLGLMVMIRLPGAPEEGSAGMSEGMTAVADGALQTEAAAPMVAAPMVAESKDVTSADELVVSNVRENGPTHRAMQAKAAAGAVANADTNTGADTGAVAGAEAPVASMAKVAQGVVSGSGQSDSLQRLRQLLDGGTWKVVVMRVPEAQHETAVQEVTSVCQKHGLALTARPMPGNESVERMGFVLTSSEAADQNEIVAELEKALGVQPDADRLSSPSQMSKEEITRAVRRSLESPTQAELFQGDLYFAAPDRSNLVAAAEALLQADAKQQKSAEAAREATEVADELTLLVLEFPMPEAI